MHAKSAQHQPDRFLHQHNKSATKKYKIRSEKSDQHAKFGITMPSLSINQKIRLHYSKSASLKLPMQKPKN
jgi:hypothetical protein